MQGSTAVMADDSGHLKPEFQRSKTNAWGNFVGTWDLPRRLPGLSRTYCMVVAVGHSYKYGLCLSVCLFSFIQAHNLKSERRRKVKTDVKVSQSRKN